MEPSHLPLTFPVINSSHLSCLPSTCLSWNLNTLCLLDSEMPCLLICQSSCIILCSTQMFLDCIGCYHILLTAWSLLLSPESVHPFVINSLFDSMVTEVRLCVFYHSEFAGIFALPSKYLITSEACNSICRIRSTLLRKYFTPF